MMSLTRWRVAVFVGGVLVASATLAESQGAPQRCASDSGAARGASPAARRRPLAIRARPGTSPRPGY